MSLSDERAECSLSDQICAAVAQTSYSALSEQDVTAAKAVLVDATGVMLAASGLSVEAQPFIEFARTQSIGDATILGTPFRCSAPHAALANGALAHALDFEDIFEAEPGHPNASLVPALLALAQTQGPVSGKQFIVALVLGCDLSCRLGLALGRKVDERGWYPPPVLAGLGAAAGAARLLGLDAAQTKDALSLMLCQNVMPGEIKYSRDTVLRAVREAFPAQAAVTSALLARAGVRGFEQPIEGRAGFAALFAGGTIAESDLLDELGDRFYVAELAFKPWPSCRGTHPFVEMALDLGNAAGFKPRDVTEIRVWVDEVQSMLVEPTARKRAPTTIIDAKFSIPYCVAAALVRGRLSLDDFSEAELLNPEILSVAAKVKSLQNGVRNSAVGGKMEIRLKSGERIQRQVTETLGSVRRPLPSDRLAAKFLDCARRARHPPCARNADAFLRKIDRLEDLQNVMPLLRLLDGV